MPAKKQQFKRTSPTTFTSRGAADQHHRLRHTGPSISTASTANATSSKSPIRAHLEHTPESPPPPETSRDTKPLAKVSPSAARTSSTKFLYVLVFLVLALFGWYMHGMITLVERLKEEVGWWGIIMGDYSRETMRWETAEFSSDQPGQQGKAEAEKSVVELESHLNAIADALGISPNQVASVVKPLVPQASIASKLKGMAGSEVVRILFEDTMRNGRDSAETTRIIQGFPESCRGAVKESVAEDEMN